VSLTTKKEPLLCHRLQARAEADSGQLQDVSAVLSGQEEGEGQRGQAKAADERVHALRQEVPARTHPAAPRKGQQVKN
jgi:hypothetical protein